MFYKKITKYITGVSYEFDKISLERKQLLESFAEFISNKNEKDEEVNLIFICTHNSRRSQFAQVWAKTSAEYYGIKNINSFSGGTEATAFNLRAVNALGKVGFEINKSDENENPIYSIQYSEKLEPLNCFSKIYNNSFNPQNNFTAIMTCSDADENCPIVFGADERFPIRYEDPKKFDDTDLEEIKYDERCREIAREMLFTFSLVNQKKS
ncbi:MAG: protein-tyrosine-phosphatase [Ignavibacteriae bacterium]|nr:protein-tyrosine-phosphatase [Ignavibacteriota bacterium]